MKRFARVLRPLGLGREGEEGGAIGLKQSRPGGASGTSRRPPRRPRPWRGAGGVVAVDAVVEGGGYQERERDEGRQPPEPEPLAGLGPAMSIGACERLEPEGIAFIGSTYADVRQGVVQLDPQADLIHADRIVSLNEIGERFLEGVARR
jgi:hypothetical protein